MEKVKNKREEAIIYCANCGKGEIVTTNINAGNITTIVGCTICEYRQVNRRE